MRLHLLGLPHTVTSPEYSHCAFTGKVLKFPAMMAGLDYEIIHYGVAGSYFSTAAGPLAIGGRLKTVEIMSRVEQNELRGHDGSDPQRFYALDANTGTPLYIEFNKRLRRALMERVLMTDLVLLPFGHGHADALAGLSYQTVEMGIGYPTLYERADFRIFESNAWRHYHQGLAKRVEGKNYEWVIPNYFDVREWDIQLEPDLTRVVFLGRIGDDKGLQTILEIAKRRPDLNFDIAGQGDPAPYLGLPNIYYVPPLVGKARSSYLGNARACVMPTVFTEPFGGVAVEAMMCGTPVLSTTYGAFTETIEDERTGFRCHTLGDFLAALDRAPDLDRQYIADRARRLYGYERVAKMYDRAFQQIADLRDAGWYTERSTFASTANEPPPAW